MAQKVGAIFMYMLACSDCNRNLSLAVVVIDVFQWSQSFLLWLMRMVALCSLTPAGQARSLLYKVNSVWYQSLCCLFFFLHP